MQVLSRLLLAISSLCLVGGGLVHAAALPSAAPVIQGANLPVFFVGAFKALWLSDSATMIVLAAALATIAVKPNIAGRALVMLLGLIPLAGAGLLYWFLGDFYAGHLMLAAGVTAIGGAWLGKRSSMDHAS